ncbi:GGDEF domain-containing protein [Luteibacter sp. SG786]|uniref:GGDEF domain-containing protein n=1 Tax=Luteibacter sp. SG786 TaxID=2587130 RepID=UPI00141DF252|nr:GGDEF domain-containing protein [Luteibacter sp. SG786]NII55411.1 diguanylate cyclase (GGDEF)-like protein [Luteibacter sp. SG786]
MVDIPTLLGYSGVLLILVAVVAALVRSTGQRSLWFALPFLMGGVGCLFMVQPHALPGRSALHLGAFFISLAYAFGWQAVRALFDEPPRMGWLALPSLVWLILAFAVFDNFPLRSISAGFRVALVAFYMSRAALTLRQHRSERLPSVRPLTILFAAAAVLAWVSLPFVAILPEPLGALPPRPWAVIFYNVQMIAEVLIAVVLMVAIRKERTADSYYQQSTRDPLTGLYNRRFFTQRLREWDVQPTYRDRAVLFFDIDHFKRINDRFGHAVGDEVIVAVARLAERVLRKRDWIFRFGGEEFVGVLPDTSLQEAINVAERLRSETERQLQTISGERLGVTISVGVVASGQPRRSVTELVLLADRLLYQAKGEGRNRVKSPSASTALPSSSAATDS